MLPRKVLPRKVKAFIAVCFAVWTLIIIYVFKQHFFGSSFADDADDTNHESRLLQNDPLLHDVVNVCLSSDEDRLIGLVATINSIYKNTRNPVKFHILVTDAAYQPLLDWLSHTQLKVVECDIKVVDLNSTLAKIRVHGGRQELAKPMNYARFYYTDYFPDLKGHVVHIDDDCIVQGDIAKLSQVPLSDNQTIAVSNDCTTISKRFAGIDREYLRYLNFGNSHIQSAGLNPLECSFNTGVYVFDADTWRARNTTARLEFWMALNARELVYGNVHGGGGSQPPMMIVFYQQYALLDPLWNVRHLGMPSGRHYSTEMIAMANLLHWSGPVKPWHGRAAYTARWDQYFIPDPNQKYRPVRKYSVESS
jgi:lipopolysaccharide biosynthesis glycosyltransferase